jgi:integrase
LLPVFGAVALRDLEPSDVYRYMTQKGDVSANRDRSLLSAAYSHARRIGAFRGDDPTKQLQYRNPEKARERLITDAELARLIVAAPPHMAQIIEFAALTGMRQGDILALRVSAATADGILYRSSKAGKLQLVRWTPALRKVWQEATQDRIAASIAFRTERRTAFTGSGFRASWRAVKLRAGLADVTFHDLRAKAATESVDATALLGHSDPKTTAKHYKRGPIISDPAR